MSPIFYFPESLLLIPVVLGLATITYTFYFIIKDFLSSIKKSNKIKEWVELDRNILVWSDEIIDIGAKREYLQFCLDMISRNNFSNYVDSYEKMDKHISKFRQEIIEKYSKHIPSLRQEVRDQKINKI